MDEPLLLVSLEDRAVKRFLDQGATRRSEGLFIPAGDMFDAAEALTDAEVGPVSVSRPDYVFEAALPIIEALASRLGASVAS